MRLSTYSFVIALSLSELLAARHPGVVSAPIDLKPREIGSRLVLLAGVALLSLAQILRLDPHIGCLVAVPDMDHGRVALPHRERHVVEALFLGVDRVCAGG